MVYEVTMPADSPMRERTIFGIGTFVAGDRRKVDLSQGQVESLRAKGFRVRLPRAEPKEEVNGILEG